MKNALVAVVTLAVAATLAGVALVLGGFYDVAATGQHLSPTYRLMDVAMRRAIGRRAAGIAVPDLAEPALRARGLALYRQHCVQCHGAPGVAPQAFALGLRPAAANLAHTARAWTAAEIYWAVTQGIRMTGMPAWEYRLAEPDRWAVVAFVMTLPELSPRDYQALLAGLAPPTGRPPPLRAPSAERGKRAMLNYACTTCHQIPGVVGADAPVGPPLDGMGARAFIAGILPNEPAHMVRWLRFPKAVAPLSAMPDLGVGEQDAHDMAAYLATLR